MTPDDLARIHAQCFETPRPWSTDEISDLIEDRFTFLVEAEQGFALGRVIAGEAELLTIAIAPEAQGHGAGRALLRAFFDSCRARDADTVFLEVSAENPVAIHLYRSEGFADSGVRKGYYKTPQGTAIDALVMQKSFFNRT